LKNYSKRRKHSRVDEEMNKGGPAAGEEVTGNNHIGGLGSMYLLPLAQVPKITRRICFKNTPWHAIVPPWCYHCFNTRGSTSTATTNTPGKTSAATTNNLDKTSAATTKQEYYHYHCNHCRNVFFLKPLEDIYHCIRS
jgi:hypothetical protein